MLGVMGAEEDSNLLVLSRKITSEETSIRFGLDYTIEPPRTELDVDFVDGAADVRQGSRPSSASVQLFQ